MKDFLTVLRVIRFSNISKRCALPKRLRTIALGVYDHTFESAEYDEQKTKKMKLEDEVPEEKKIKLEDEDSEESNKIKLEAEDQEENTFQKTRENEVKKNLENSFITGIPLTTMPGHTGYLTFATLK